MQNEWIIETVAELAFLQRPMRFLEYGMEKGIILIADDDESAMILKIMLESHLDAVGIKFNGKKESLPLNYQMGVYVYSRLDNEKRLLDFLEEENFLPIVVVGGIVPEILMGRGYMFRCTLTEERFFEIENKYRKFTDFIKNHTSQIINLMKSASSNISFDKSKIQKYIGIYKKLMVIEKIWRKFYENAKISEEDINIKCDEFCKKVYEALEIMDRYERGYNVQAAIRECFLQQANKGKVKISSLEEDSAIQSLKDHILYDDNFYYVEDSTLREICSSLLATVSFVQLKNEMIFSDLVDCNAGKTQNFTRKKLVWRSNWQQERVRLIWIKKESLMTDDGMLLENIWEDKPC